LPIPVIVYAPATIHPARWQAVCAPREAIAETIHVTGGQPVSKGDPLVSLSDPRLDEEISRLQGRRSVLIQQKERWTRALIESPADELPDGDRTRGQQRLVAEELRSVDAQLALLNRIRDSLILRADRDGHVHGWRLHERFEDRPLDRGQEVMRVIADESPWVADATVPQKRIGRLSNALDRGLLRARVAPDAAPDHRFDASIQQLGPVLARPQGESPSIAVRLRLTANDDAPRSALRAESYNGAPARVLFRCGSAPAAAVIFQDTLRSARGFLGLYLGGDDEEGAS
jgi:multidrug efflux pump subunit AcrA (membrane-fusion protein)